MRIPKLAKVASQFYATTDTPVQIRLYKVAEGWQGVYRIDRTSSPVKVCYPTRRRALRACMEHLKSDFVKLDDFAEYLES